MWPRIAPSRVSVTVYKLIWALTDGSHRSMLLGCINCDSQLAAVNFFRRSTFRSLPARLMTGGGYRLLASGQTLEGSFSAVWTATIATKYSFCSIFRDLQDYQNGFPIFAIFQCLCTVFSKFRKILPIFVEIGRFRSDFDDFFSEFH